MAVCLMALLLSKNCIVYAACANVSLSAITEINDILFSIIEGIGDILMVLGVWRYGIGHTTDQAQELSKGISSLVCGAILANIRSVIG